jgi:CheY-like chemotaxis protein
MDGEGDLTLSWRRSRGCRAFAVTRRRRGPFVAVHVTDTGVGIAPGDLDRIFEPFFTTKEIGRGTGLGLSQVFGFAKQSAGEIDVASRPGEGTTFSLYLPRADRPPQGEAVRPQAVSTHLRARVLLVEDNLQVGDFAAQLLTDLGHQVERVTNAAEALERLSSGDTFDVVFSDVVMPGVSGLELARRIEDRWPGVPVLLTSGYSHVLAQDARHGFPLLRKPYSVEELSSALRRAITRAG